MLKQYADTCLCDMLACLFSASFDQSTVPLDWKVARVRPIHKAGNKTDPSNYRPISLTSQCSKLFEHIITKHIVSYLEENNILSPQQHGFRSRYSTVTQLVEFDYDIVSALNRRNYVHAIFLDFAKAFDRVPQFSPVECYYYPR